MPSLSPAEGTGALVRQSQLLRLLEAAAARRGNLELLISERESALRRIEGERAAAHASLQMDRADEHRAAARLAAIHVELRGAEDVLRRAVAPPVEPTGVGVDNRPLSPLDRLAVGKVAVGAPAPHPAELGAAHKKVLHRHSVLTATATAHKQYLMSLAERTAAAEQALAVKVESVNAARRSLDDVREQLWSAVREDPAMRQARALTTAPDAEPVEPTPFARGDIPAQSLDLYRRAALTCPGLSWTVVAAIASMESDHGRSAAPGVRRGANSAGAMGPMQFLAGTWASYGVDGNGDGKRDVYVPEDAVFGAVSYLCASGAGRLASLADALWAYNHAGWYVDDALALALRYGVNGLGLGEAASDVHALLQNGNLTLSEEARSDLLSGIADSRVVKVLAAAAAHHRIAVSVIKTGHSKYVAGTDRVSNHYYGRGVDIYAVDGTDVSATNDAALDLALALLTSGSDLRPEEFGSPWPELARFPGAFSDEGHRGHLHVAWRSDAR